MHEYIGSLFSFRSCDPNLFSLFHSGTVLPTAKLTVDSYNAMMDALTVSKKKKHNQTTGKRNVLTGNSIKCL
jgi:hypothetical protein